MTRFANYGPNDFTDDGILKVSPLLWLVLLYLCRHVLILALGGFTVFVGSRRGLDTQGLSVLYSSPAFLIASAPALVVLVTHFRRVPNAGALIRAIWGKGKWWLVAAASFDLAVLVWHWHSGALQPNQFQVAGAILDLYIIAYLLRSKRVRDTFADFPVKKDP